MKIKRVIDAAAFCRWLQAMRETKSIRYDADAANLLGITPVALSAMKRNGADKRTALACRALYHNMEPWE